MEKKLRIEIREGVELLRHVVATTDSEITIGRSPQSDVVLESREVSRNHAAIILGEAGFRVSDLSTNGVLFGGNRVDKDQELEFGSVVELGPFSLMIAPDGETDRGEDPIEIRRRALASLIDHVDLSVLSQSPQQLRPRVEAALTRIVHKMGVAPEETTGMVGDLTDEALGLGPLEKLLEDDSVTEIMVVDPSTVFVERNGRIELTPLVFSSEDSVRTIIERIVTPLGRRIDEASPMVDARLLDGSRVNAVIPPLSIRGPNITIRKFAKTPLGMSDLIDFGTLDRAMADFLERAVTERHNIVISGGTGSGKTTLLNVLAGSIPPGERIITIEDAAELRLGQPHVVTLETRPANAEGKGQVTIRDLVKNALRMRPDRIVVGECRGGEALDMLQAMNTGHDGSLTTTHANAPTEAISRLETLCLMAGVDLPARAIREQIVSAVDLIVQQTRLSSGARRITSITEICGLEEDGSVATSEIFRHVSSRNNRDESGFVPTGWLPSFELGGPR